MESKNKEWIAIVVCIITGVVANIQSFGNESTQKVYHEKVYDTTLHHRSAILDVREKIDYLYRRVARLEDASRILPPGPGQVPPPEMDAGVHELDEIDETPEEVQELFGPDPEKKDSEPKPKPAPPKIPFEIEKNGAPKWDPIEQPLPAY